MSDEITNQVNETFKVTETFGEQATTSMVGNTVMITVDQAKMDSLPEADRTKAMHDFMASVSGGLSKAAPDMRMTYDLPKIVDGKGVMSINFPADATPVQIAAALDKVDTPAEAALSPEEPAKPGIAAFLEASGLKEKYGENVSAVITDKGITVTLTGDAAKRAEGTAKDDALSTMSGIRGDLGQSSPEIFAPIPTDMASMDVSKQGVTVSRYAAKDGAPATAVFNMEFKDGMTLDQVAAGMDKYAKSKTAKAAPVAGVDGPAAAPGTGGPAEDKDRGILGFLQNNMGLGGGLAIGAFLGAMMGGGPLGMIFGALLGAGLGSFFVDKGDGMLGLNDQKKGPNKVNEKLKEAALGYAKVRFTDLNTGEVNQAKADKFVERYTQIMSRSAMSQEDQLIRAGEIQEKTAEITAELKKGPKGDLAKAVQEARETMKETDRMLGMSEASLKDLAIPTARASKEGVEQATGAER